MSIPLFKYNQTIHLASTNYHGQKENTTMFQPSLRVHKNMTNPIHVTISDRDRVRVKVNEGEEVPFKLRVRIINRQRIVIYNEYLVPVVDGNFFKINLGVDVVNSLESEETYKYTITQVDNLTNEETPLYIDHNFNVMGNLEVVSNFMDTYTEISTHTEEYLTRERNKDVRLKSKHYFTTPILRHEDLVSVMVKSNDPSVLCMVTIEKDNQSRYPMTERPAQWDEIATLNPRPEGITLPITLIPERVYFRVVIHTDRPENFYLELTKRQQ